STPPPPSPLSPSRLLGNRDGCTARQSLSCCLLQLKRIPDQKIPRKPVTDDVFTFDQLLTLNNYALNKPSQQSSVFLEVLDIPELDGESDFAVDGSVTTCARTGLLQTFYFRR
ncbi:hypothetical protein BaRGS_00007269, partial [Batillaria attramentaria]